MKRYSEILRELRKRMSEEQAKPVPPTPEQLAELKAIREKLAAPKPQKEPA